MIKRISMWKLNDKTQAVEMKSRLLSMASKVPSLNSIEVGINESAHHASYDIVFIGTFLNKQALSEFENDDYHKQVGEYVASLRSDRKVVEYTV